MAEMIYLACPFRHADPFVQRKRCAATHYVAAHYALQGQHVFSPLTHNEMLIDIIDDAVPGEHWMQFDLAILAVCKHLYVLTMDGWELSKGVAREIAFAKERKIAVKMIEPPEEAKYLPWIRANLPVNEKRLPHSSIP
jgi:hypothetical protein